MKKPKALKTILLGSLMAMLLSGCGMSGSADSAFSPIYIHKDDYLTDGTARQILGHNELGKNILGWKNNNH
jgi:hypothetical protein